MPNIGKINTSEYELHPVRFKCGIRRHDNPCIFDLPIPNCFQVFHADISDLAPFYEAYDSLYSIHSKLLVVLDFYIVFVIYLNICYL
jgi:hypothetical protein